jgi:hypothetical protein
MNRRDFLRRAAAATGLALVDPRSLVPAAPAEVATPVAKTMTVSAVTKLATTTTVRDETLQDARVIGRLVDARLRHAFEQDTIDRIVDGEGPR